MSVPGRLFVVLACGATLSESALGDTCEPPCNCSVVPAQGKWAYRSRADRCEGLYDSPISHKRKEKPLELVSFTFGRVLPEPDSSVLKFAWAGSSEVLTLTASPRVPNVYHRMDATAPASSSGFSWNLDVVKATNRNLADLGFVLRSSRDTYAPVASVGAASVATQSAYYLVVVPRLMVKDLVARVLDSAGKIVDKPSIPSVICPRDRGVEFAIPAPHAPGSFLLHLEAKCLEGCDGKEPWVISDHSFQIP
jgi:hypothetical protein